MELTAKPQRQETLFDNKAARAKSAKLMAAMYAVNNVWGRCTLRSGRHVQRIGYAIREQVTALHDQLG